MFGRFCSFSTVLRPILVKNGQNRLEINCSWRDCSGCLAEPGRGSVAGIQVTRITRSLPYNISADQRNDHRLVRASQDATVWQPKLHNMIPARNSCVTDVLCSEAKTYQCCSNAVLHECWVKYHNLAMATNVHATFAHMTNQSGGPFGIGWQKTFVQTAWVVDQKTDLSMMCLRFDVCHTLKCGGCLLHLGILRTCVVNRKSFLEAMLWPWEMGSVTQWLGFGGQRASRQ